MRPKEPKHRRRDLTVGSRHKDEGIRVQQHQEVRSLRCADRRDLAVLRYDRDE